MSPNHTLRPLLAVMILLIQLPQAFSALNRTDHETPGAMPAFGLASHSNPGSTINSTTGHNAMSQAVSLSVGEPVPAGFEPGSLITLPIVATGFTGANRLEAITLFVTYNAEVLEYTGYTIRHLSGVAVFPQPGVFALAWSSINPVEIEADTLLFLQFEYLGGHTLVNFREDSELANHEEVIDVIFTGNELGTLIESYTLYYVAGEGGRLEGETTQVVQEGGNGSAILAIPSEGYYYFTGWSDGRTDNPRIDQAVTTNIAVTALFAQIAYELTVAAEPAGYGTARIFTDPPFFHGMEIHISAIPEYGYQFLCWTNDGVLLSDLPEYSFTIFQDLSLVAHFKSIKFSVTAEAVPVIGGTVAGNGLYDYNTRAALEAMPAEGYMFEGWYEGGNLAGIEPELNVMVLSDRHLEARFTQLVYTLTYLQGPGGQIQGASLQYVAHGQNGTAVLAVPDEGYHFTGWSDGRSDNPRTDIEIKSDLTVTATFSLNQYDLTVTAEPPLAGTAHIVNEGPFHHGTQVMVQATPSYGYAFAHWLEGATTVWEEADYQFTVLNDRSLTAVFVPLSFTIDAAAVPPEGGAVAGAGNYVYQAVALLTATPAEGYDFAGWFDGEFLAGSAPELLFTVLADRFFEARFVLKTYSLNYLAGFGGRIEGPASQTVAHKQDGSPVLAIADDGYYFAGWSDGVMDNPRTDRAVTAGLSVTAIFAQPGRYIVSLNANPAGAGILTGAGSYIEGDEAVVNAVAANGYRFTHWASGAAVVSVLPEYSFEVWSNTALTAFFTPLTYTLAYSAGDGGSIEGDVLQEVMHGLNGSAVLAVPDQGFHFTGWSDGQTYNPRTDMNIVADIMVEAVFAINEYSLTVLAVPEEGGTAVGAGTYTHNSLVCLEASPNEGFAFSGWFESDTLAGEGPELHIHLTSDRMLEAHFALKTYTLTYLAGDGGRLEGAAIQDVVHGHDGTAVYAVPVEGFHFEAWSDGRKDNPRTDTDVAAGLTVTATFTLNSYELIVSVEPEDAGQVQLNTAGPYFYGMEVQVIATPSHEYDFYCWKEDGEVVYESSEYSFVLTASRFLVAEFVQRTYTVVFSVVSNRGGAVNDAEITFDEIPYSPGHYRFEKLLPGVYAYSIARNGYFDMAGQVSVEAQDVLVEATLAVDDVGIGNAAAPGSPHSLKVYPNPARQWLQLSASEAIIEVKLFDITGKLLIHLANAIPEKEMTLSLSGLRKGPCIIVVDYGHNYETRRILVAD